MRIAIATLATAAIKEIGELAGANKRKYCQRHGYDFVQWDEADNSRPPSWSKILMLRSVLSRYDWVFWSDADSVITNPDVPLQHFLSDYADIVITGDVNAINAGQFLVRGCSWSLDFLDRIWRQSDLIDHPWWETAAINRLYIGCRNHIRILPQRTFNSYHHFARENRDCGDWRPGDFLIHFAGIRNSARLPLMKRYLDFAEQDGVAACERMFARSDLGYLLNRLDLLGEGAEVGVARGEFACQILDSWFGATLHLVDAWRHLPGYVDICNVSDSEHELNLKKALTNLKPHDGRFMIHKCLSCEGADRFANGSLDFVYLDANHAHAAFVGDLKGWYPKIKPGGLFCGHDFLDGYLPSGVYSVKENVTRFADKRGLTVYHTTEQDWPSWYFRKPSTTKG